MWQHYCTYVNYQVSIRDFEYYQQPVNLTVRMLSERIIHVHRGTYTHIRYIPGVMEVAA
jgi:hypothetical protein